jgi:hypothetical protein
MLYHFLLLFPLGFKGVLTTYQIQLSSYFSHWVFGGEILKMKNFQDDRFTKNSIVYKGILFTRTLSRLSKKISEDYTRYFQEMALSKGEC